VFRSDPCSFPDLMMEVAEEEKGNRSFWITNYIYCIHSWQAISPRTGVIHLYNTRIYSSICFL
jgi:hypothetical protein